MEENNESNKELNNICEECNKENENVSQNLIMYGYKICESCRTSKSIFPVYLGPKILIIITKKTAWTKKPITTTPIALQVLS